MKTEKNTESQASNIYAWALSKVLTHNDRFKGGKYISMSVVMEIIDRADTDFQANPHFDGKLLDYQKKRVKTFLRNIRDWDVKLDMTDNISHLDYDLLPIGHPFRRSY